MFKYLPACFRAFAVLLGVVILSPAASAADLVFTAYDDPDNQTFAVGMDGKGNIFGDYYGPSTDDEDRGFMRTPQGKYTDIVYPDGTFTSVSSLTHDGRLLGVYRNAWWQYQPSTGVFTTTQVPNPKSLVSIYMNRSGMLAGSFSTIPGGSYIGFVARDGVYTEFSVPDSQFTRVRSINDRGQVAGNYALIGRSREEIHNFIREPDGTLRLIDDVRGPSNGALDLQVLRDNGDYIGSCSDGEIYLGCYYDASTGVVFPVVTRSLYNEIPESMRNGVIVGSGEKFGTSYGYAVLKRSQTPKAP